MCVRVIKLHVYFGSLWKWSILYIKAYLKHQTNGANFYHAILRNVWFKLFSISNFVFYVLQSVKDACILDLFNMFSNLEIQLI